RIGGFTLARLKIAFRAARRFLRRSPIFEPSATAVLIVVATIADRGSRGHRPRLQVYSPSTSFIEYSPGGLLIVHFAARKAPPAKIPRFAARCVSSKDSPGSPKITVCSPT